MKNFDKEKLSMMIFFCNLIKQISNKGMTKLMQDELKNIWHVPFPLEKSYVYRIYEFPLFMDASK